ncbi:hypothetical protein PMG71_22150 [Roseofilum sp. BLCC_M154]|uniref:Uncharacterized protein n=1 Tax=Roseofilum acuticapitatum BLCC-M154 TaxID=3022444 RepID=A0ABT7AZ30_9CYAN|nr:hypothetical protein [Roseofilum acuticapitatum]MDJ1172135.1 hypothetical protein [Roseofilum acuticapitatum BLCC-M154]
MLNDEYSVRHLIREFFGDRPQDTQEIYYGIHQHLLKQGIDPSNP